MDRVESEWSDLVSELADQFQATFQWPLPQSRHAVVTTEMAPQRSLAGAMAVLAHAMAHPEEPVALRPEQLVSVQEHKARGLREYYLACYARWCGPQHELDRRFVRLTLVYDEGTTSSDRWVTMPSTRQSDDLGEILTATDSFAYVLLGAPGSGKTTLLHRLEMDAARAALVPGSSPTRIPFSVSLAEYGLGGSGNDAPDPVEWLQQRWSARNPHLPPLLEFLGQGRILLLIDGLNEMSHYDANDLRVRVDRWRSFLYEWIRDVPGNRAVFACRTLDYGAMLSTKDVGVPHIRLEPMSRQQALAYIDLHLPGSSAAVRQVLTGDERTLSFYRTPYMLKLLVGQVRAIGTVPVGRADAFTAMIRELLRREIISGNQRVNNPELLTERERRRLRDGVRDPYWLPDSGHLVPALTRLAYQMQVAKKGGDKGAVVVDYDTAVKLLNGLARIAEASLHVGFDTGILDEHEETVRFFHQLLQEFFAARQLSRAGDVPQLAVPTRADQVVPALEEQLDALAAGEPLPPLASTGWEETAVIAAALAVDADLFVRRVMAVNPALAGRCVAAADVRVTAQTRRAVADRLLRGVGDVGEDLRARIAFGDALAGAGDPRFAVVESVDGSALVPPFARVPAGRYRCGAPDSAYPLERPVHEVELAEFDLAVVPVTNAEFERFVRAGGYTDLRWWRTGNARSWLGGSGLLPVIQQEWRKKRDGLRRHPRLPVDLLASGHATLTQAVSMVKLTEMSDEQLRGALEDLYGNAAPISPAYWQDSWFNLPARPVVGVSVYEAEAYCAWLSAVTGERYRLPREHEWEAAAGPQEFPFGPDFDRALANTFELNVRSTIPVGIMPAGVSDVGCHDLCGNVFEWTASEYQPYPYRMEGAPSDAVSSMRICRGGSWRHHQVRARSAYRGRGQCFVRNDDLGFRLAR
nr:SUMF1/EgtB/PvdO family nonheme iron enzyme [Frankia umida]